MMNSPCHKVVSLLEKNGFPIAAVIARSRLFFKDKENYF